jgi:L-lactate utilization protein LutC
LPKAREIILGRIKTALTSAPAGVKHQTGHHSQSDGARPRTATPQTDRAALLETLRSELARVRATSYAASNLAEAGQIIGDIAREHHADTIVAWASCASAPDLLRDLSLRNLRVVTESHCKDNGDFRSTAEAALLGLTEVDFAVAETGSLVLLSGAGKPRSVSLLPPIHIALVNVEQIVPDIPALLDRVAGQESPSPASAITFITGPSRTADIELTLVIGVHGPQELHVIIVDRIPASR